MTAKRRLPPFLDWKAILGLVLSAGLLAFALRGVDAARVLHEIAQADPLTFVASIVATTATFAVRAWRWRPLLRPVRPGLGFRPSFAATTIGFMANNLLPARIGEFARAYALSRMERVPLTASIGSLVVERLFDGLTILLLLFIAMASPAFPGMPTAGSSELETVATFLTVLFAGVGLLLTAMVIWPARLIAAFERIATRVLPRGARKRVIGALEAFLAGLGALRQPRLLLEIALGSLALWLLGAFSYWLALRAFDIHVPFTAALFLQSLISLAVALPSAPGFFGVYEAGARIGLVDVWGVEVNKALGFAIGFHMGGFLPVTLIGLAYVWRLGLSWREVEHSEEVVEEAVEAATAGPPAQPPAPEAGDEKGS